MACTLAAIQEAACTSGIAKEQSKIKLLQLIAQLTCEASEGGGGGAAVWGGITGTLSNQVDLQAALDAAAGTAVWGSITGTLSNQTDLQNALDAKLNLSGGQLTGNLTFSADNTLDIGASGATRPRRGYFGTEVVSPLFTGSLTGASSLNVLKAGDTMTGLLTIAQATANTSALAVTGYSLTGANAQSLLSLAGTWNTSGTPTAIDLNITDTASNASSKLLNLRVGGSTVLSVDKTGAIIGSSTGKLLVAASSIEFSPAGVLRAMFNSAGALIGRDITLLSSDSFGISSSSSTSALNTQDVSLFRDAANVFAQRRTTNAQTFRWYRTFTDASNYERGALQTAAGEVIIAAETAGTGTDDIDLTLTPAGAGNVRFGTHSALAGETLSGFITFKDAAGNVRKLAVIS